MNTPASSLEVALRAVAVIQIAIVALKFALAQVLGLNDAITSWPAAVRELFVVHVSSVSLTILTISVLTLRFAREIAEQADAICRWLAGAAAIFWLLRGWLKWVYGLDSPWPINHLHWALMAVDGCLALVYGLAAWSRSERD